MILERCRYYELSILKKYPYIISQYGHLSNIKYDIREMTVLESCPY